MKILNVEQGSEEWKKNRSERFNASEAPAMMGESKYMSRDELLHMKKTREIKPVSGHLQKIFDEGHRTEALARQIIEKDHGIEYDPLVGVRLYSCLNLLASFDGINIENKSIFEHKLANDELLMDTVNGNIAPLHYWQLEHQLFVSEAEKVYFVVSDGTADNRAILEYKSIPERRKQLLAGWKQFLDDLENYEPKEKKEKVEAKSIDGLPELSIIVSGNVENSNLPAFQSEAERFIKAIKTDLKNDQDFADAEKTVKFLSSMEKSLDGARQKAIDGTVDIANLYKVIDNLKALARSKRLDLDKLVKFEKQNIRGEILSKVIVGFQVFCKSFENSIHPASLRVSFDPATAIKGKKTIESLENAANTELARAKIDITSQVNGIAMNLNHYNSESKEFDFLFRDLGLLLHKENDDFKACSRVRIEDYKKQEEDRIAKEELKKEEDRKAEEDRLAKEELKKQEEGRKGKLPEETIEEPEKPEVKTDDKIEPEPFENEEPFIVCPHCKKNIYQK